MNKLITGRWAWLIAAAVAYSIFALFLAAVGASMAKEVVDVSRIAVYAIILGTYGPVGVYIIMTGQTAPKWHGLLGVFALGAAVFAQGALILARRMLARPEISGSEVLMAIRGVLAVPELEVFVALNFVLAGLLFLSGPHLADPELPRRTFRWLIVSVGVVCVIAGILIGRFFA